MKRRRKKKSPIDTARAKELFDRETAWYQELKQMFPNRPYISHMQTIQKRVYMHNNYLPPHQQVRMVYFTGGITRPDVTRWKEFRTGARSGHALKTAIIRGAASLSEALGRYKNLLRRSGIKSTRSNREAWRAHLVLSGFWSGLTTRNQDPLAPESWDSVRESVRQYRGHGMRRILRDWYESYSVAARVEPR